LKIKSPDSGKRRKRQQEIINEIVELEKQRKYISYYAKDKKRPDKIWYVRYADDFVILIAGNKEETETIKNKVKAKLADMGLELSDEKNKTHWSNSIMFLGYQIQGKQRAKGIGIRAVLSIPKEKSKMRRKT
jgi:hypothetical protein